MAFPRPREVARELPLSPEMISTSKLPVGLRGYRRQETEDLLRRVAWDYQQLVHERDTLAEQVWQLEQARDDLEADKALLRAELKELEAAAAEQSARRAVEPDAAAALLATTQKAARALRESTRAECQAIIAKARKQAAELERQARANVEAAAAEVERLHRLQDDVRTQVRGLFEATLRELQPRNGGEQRPHLSDELTRSLAGQ